MSHLVLARKYRPRSFEQLVGQEHVVQALSNALTAGRLHHAYLFTGTRGVGKTTVSRLLAKCLNCTGPDGRGGVTAQPCGVCEACRDIDAGRHVDYVELDAASNRGVDEMSQLLDQAVYKPVVGRFKVYMIDEVHMLSNHAFNAMLKTLEEPPEYLKFVLATTDPQKVPPTVLSRCLQFNLRPMAAGTVQGHLQQVLASEGLEAEPAALRLLARAARGSMRDALSLADQAIAYGAGRLETDGVRRMLGAVDRGQALRVLNALAERDPAALLATADELRHWGYSASGLLDELAGRLQALAIAQVLPAAVDADDESEREMLMALAGRFAAEELQLWYSMALHGREELPLAPDEYAGLVMVLLRMLAFRADSSTEAGSAGARAVSPALESPAAAPVAIGTASRMADTPSSPPASPPARPAAAIDTRPTATDAARPPATATHPASPASESSATARALRREPVASSATAVALPTTPSRDAGPADSAGPGRAPGAPSPAGRQGPAIDVASGPTRAPPGGEASLSPAVPGAAPSGDAGQGATPADPLVDRWVDIVRQLVEQGAVAAMVRELALQAQLVHAGDDGLWRLRVERESLRSTSQRDRLQAALAHWLGAPVRLELEAGIATDSPALREAAARARLQAEAERIIQDDPDVQALMQRFGSARIVPGSIKPTERPRP